MNKTVISVIINIMLVVALIAGVIWGVTNFSKLQSVMSGAKTNLYTDDDLSNAYLDGYNTALKNRDKYEALLTEYRVRMAELENNLILANQRNAELEMTINALTEYNAALKALLDAVPEIKERFVVTFMFDDAIYAILLVPDGEKIELQSPVSNEYTIFLGWSLSLDGELIDLSTYEITKDTIIYAKIIRKYDVTFVYDNGMYQHQIVLKGDTAKLPNMTYNNFLGWSVNGVDIIDVANNPIWQHTVYFAITEPKTFRTIKGSQTYALTSTRIEIDLKSFPNYVPADFIQISVQVGIPVAVSEYLNFGGYTLPILVGYDTAYVPFNYTIPIGSSLGVNTRIYISGSYAWANTSYFSLNSDMILSIWGNDSNLTINSITIYG